MKISQSYK